MITCSANYIHHFLHIKHILDHYYKVTHFYVINSSQQIFCSSRTSSRRKSTTLEGSKLFHIFSKTFSPTQKFPKQKTPSSVKDQNNKTLYFNDNKQNRIFLVKFPFFSSIKLCRHFPNKLKLKRARLLTHIPSLHLGLKHPV